MKTMPTILVVGSGNVAWHLCNSFNLSKYKIRGVAARSLEKLQAFKSDFSIETFSLNDFPEVDIVLLAVSDSSIPAVSEIFKNSNSTIAHTSGAFGIKELHVNIKNKGVFYPFQTFTKGNSNLDYSSIPTFLESNSEQVDEHLKYLSKAFGSNLYFIDTEAKKGLHIAGVIANNFINKLLQESITLLEQNKIPQEVIWPLVEETLKKAKLTGPLKAQTGPAIRNDQTTINEHLEYLENEPNLQNIYLKLTQLIQE